MSKLFALAAAALMIGAAIPAQARDDTPGHKMQKKGSVKGHPGASGYSPGHQMQAKGSKKRSPGASGYAPGHNR
jgi:hypothetical protein